MKKLTAKTGEYKNDQGEVKGRYTDIGVILSNENGEYMLLDPSVNLAGLLMKQNAYMATKGKTPKDSVMISIFEKNNNSGTNFNQAAPNQQGFNQPNNGTQVPNNGFNNPPPAPQPDGFDDLEPPF